MSASRATLAFGVYASNVGFCWLCWRANTGMSRARAFTYDPKFSFSFIYKDLAFSGMEALTLENAKNTARMLARANKSQHNSGLSRLRRTWKGPAMMSNRLPVLAADIQREHAAVGDAPARGYERAQFEAVWRRDLARRAKSSGAVPSSAAIDRATTANWIHADGERFVAGASRPA